MNQNENLNNEKKLEVAHEGVKSPAITKKSGSTRLNEGVISSQMPQKPNQNNGSDKTNDEHKKDNDDKGK